MAKFNHKKAGKPVTIPEKETLKTDVQAEKLTMPTPKGSIVKTPKIVADLSGSVTDKKPVVSFRAQLSAAKYSPETLEQRISQFNREVLSSRFVQRSMLVEKAMELLGGEIKELTGANINEVAFEISGIRVPSEGFYMIR